MAFNINQYLDEIKKNIDVIDTSYNIIIGNNTIIDELKNDYINLQKEVNKPNNTHAAYNLIAIITFKLDSIHGILIGIEITKQTAATTELTTEITNANSALKQAQEELNKQIHEKKAAEEAAEELKKEITSLTANAKTQEETIEEFNDTLTKNDAELKRLQDELNNRVGATAISQSQLDVYKAKETQLLKENENIESKIKSYNVSIESNKTELQNKKVELNTLTTDIANARTMVYEKKQQLMNTKRETELLMKEIETATNENDKLKHALEQKKKEYSELLTQTEALGLNIKNLTGEINAAKLLKEENDKKKKEAQEELNRINAEKTQAVNDLTEINKQKTEAQAKLKTLQAEISNLEGIKTGIETGIKETEAKLELLQEQKDKLNAQNVELRDKQEILKEQNVILTADNELLKGKIKENEKVNEELITKKRQEVETQITKLENELKQKNSDLKNVEKSISTKTTENKRLSLTNAALQTKINNDINAYEDRLLEAYETIKETSYKITELQAETQHLENEKDALIAKVESNKTQIKISKNVIVTLTQQQQELQTTNADLLLQKNELEASNDAANKELFNTLANIGTNEGIIADQLKEIGKQEQIITKQKLQIDKLNQEIYRLEQSRDSLIKLLDTKSEELIRAGEELNEIQTNLTAKQNELTSKKKELEDIERREKTLIENEAKLLQRTEELEERAKIQADKDTLLAEIERMNAENNTLQQDNQVMSDKLEGYEKERIHLNKEVKNYEELLQDKQDEFERSIAELEEQQMVEAKLEFEVLLNKIDALKADYETNKATKSIYKSVGSLFVDVDNGWNAYFESIGTLINLSENNKYFNYLIANVIDGYNNDDHVVNINRYIQYEEIYNHSPPKIPSPSGGEEQSDTSQIQYLNPPDPDENLFNLVLKDEFKIESQNKITLLKLYLYAIKVYDNTTGSYRNTLKNFFKKFQVDIINFCNEYLKKYITTQHNTLKYGSLIDDIKLIIKNNDQCSNTEPHKNVMSLLANINGSNNEHINNLNNYDDTLNTVIDIFKFKIAKIYTNCLKKGGGKKTKRNTRNNKKTRRTHK